MNNLITVEDVKMYFSIRKGLFQTIIVKAVDGVTLNIIRGKNLALVGESGSGKTTLGRLTLRLLQPTSGRIVFNSHDITEADEEELKDFRRHSQIIFQDPYSSIDPFLNIYQILEEPLLIHKLRNEEERIESVYHALEAVKLTPVEEFVKRYPHMLSGGQRQRVGIARALILNPYYVVADEPVSMIDASSRVEILHLLQDLRNRYGITFLYITHDIATAKYFSDRIAVMYLGRIVELTPSHQLIKNPLHPYTMALIESVPEPDPSNRLKERRVIPGEPPSPIHIPSGCRFHPRCPYFMKGICDTVDLQLEEVRPGHYVACHLHRSF